MNERILIVDDNLDALNIMRHILEARGYRVRAASGGHEALQCVREEAFDVVLLDVMMPQMSGIEVLQHLKSDAHTGRLPVVLVTAKSQDEDMLAGYQHGADYYVPKPYTAKQLVYGVELVLGKGDGAD